MGAAEATPERGLSAQTVKPGLVQVLQLLLKVWSSWANYLTISVTQFPHLRSGAKNNITLVGCYEEEMSLDVQNA